MTHDPEALEFKFALLLQKEKLRNVFYSVETALTYRNVSDDIKILIVTCDIFTKTLLVINHFMLTARTNIPINIEVLSRIMQVSIAEVKQEVTQ